MWYKRRYIQFNELVLDTYDMVSETEHRVDFKTSTHDISYGHGSYIVRKRNYQYAKEQEVSLTIRLKMKKLPCEYRKFYKQFALTEVLKPGKLWAVVNNELIWAYADITSYSEGEDAVRDEFIINVDFILPEGVWHKADKQKTFLMPYDICTYMDCKGYEEVKPCVYSPDFSGNCCQECKDRKADERANEETCECCCCDDLTKDMALCYNEDLLQTVYKKCEPTFQVVYSCRKGKEFFGTIGNKICTESTCSSIIAGHFYSDTELPTMGVEVIIDGAVKNPQIDINGNANVIMGEYEGLRIKPNGDVYALTECCETLLDPDVWEIGSGEYGWEVHQGTNRVIIERGSCCGVACAYIRADSLTV